MLHSCGSPCSAFVWVLQLLLQLRAGNRNPDMFALPHIIQAQVVSRDVSQQIKANAGTAKHL